MPKDINWNFGSQKPKQTSSNFTEDADAAFDKFCKQYLYNDGPFYIEPKSFKDENDIITKVDDSTQNNSTNIQINTLKDNLITDHSILGKSGKSQKDKNIHKQYSFEDVLEVYNKEFKNEKNVNSKKNSKLSSSYHDTLETKNTKPKNQIYSHNEVSQMIDNLTSHTINGKNQKKSHRKRKHTQNPPPEKSQNSLTKQNAAEHLKTNYETFSNNLNKYLNDMKLKEQKFKKTQNDKIECDSESTNKKVIYHTKSDPTRLEDSTTEKTTEVQEKNIENKKQEKWLSLKVIGCGMRKYGMPKDYKIPVENFFIDKGDFGDDAGFWSETKNGCACGIADGATGNSRYGYDPGDFSRNLMELCSELFITENKNITDARDLLLQAYDIVQDKSCYGSCTSCVVTLDHSSNILTAVNVGDSGYCLLRDGTLVHASEPERLSYECPKQLDSYPWKQESREMGVSYTEILGSDTMCDSIEVMKDDIIIISSDGLYDNLDFEEIEDIFQKSKTSMDAVENLVYNSIKFCRKPDDILVLIAQVVENTTHRDRQLFSIQPTQKI